MKLRLIASLLIAISFVLRSIAVPSLGRAEPFRDGETVCFLGDSITKGGQYISMIHLFYATRYPDRRINFVNCGVGGDRARAIMEGAKFRLDVDVFGHKPDVVSVMLGMNDVNRNNFASNMVESDALVKKRAAFDGYVENMGRIAKEVTARQARLILMTPTMYDEKVTLPPGRPVGLIGLNAELGTYADWVKTTAPLLKAGLVNCYDIMVEVNEQQLAKNAAYSLLGAGQNWNDRVHPGPHGHLIMAYAYLKAQELPRFVSKISPDSAQQLNCSVENIKMTATGIEFDCLEGSLPFVPPKTAIKGMNLVPFDEELNQQLLIVGSLKSGDYELKIDGRAIGVFSHEALSAGVNLATQSSTPQYLQSQKLAELMLQVGRAREALREVATKRYWMTSKGMDPMNHDEYAKVVRSDYETIKAKGERVAAWLQIQYTEVVAPGELQRQLDAALAAFNAFRQPKSHHFSLNKVNRM